jgi:hypothetical protein
MTTMAATTLEQFKAACDEFIRNAQAGNAEANRAMNIGDEFIGFSPVSPFPAMGMPAPPPVQARPQVHQEWHTVYNDDLGVYTGLWTMMPVQGGPPPPVP